MGHRRFEGMCALAITGQLGGAQMCELDEHIAVCKRCREYLESVAQFSVQAMPVLAEGHAPALRIAPPEGMRERLLARVAADTGSGELHPFPAAKARPQLVSRERTTAANEPQRLPRRPRAVSAASLLLLSTAAGCAVTAVVAVAAYRTGMRRAAAPAVPIVQAPPTAAIAPAPTQDPDPERMKQLERQKSDLKAKLASVRRELGLAQAENETLGRALATANEQSAEQLTTLQADVSRLKQRLADSEVIAMAQKQANQELSSRLEKTATDLQLERDLKSAKLEMGDLAAARNLHIVDVYDADPSGKRQRSFGRVFYIENQSLVFYAYDLDDPGRFKANVVFHVWGGKAGTKAVTHSLGILRRDDANQNRWAMSFDDPNVLAQINSVFVTAELASRHADEPHGKRVLYAYFGSPPNHP